ncbi:hypothetical protein BC940DRAFT_323618 [Gongronella butleri]|nr:hypothetical protein BC940DRAFT_323618 [Gongronella butleri]
MGYGTVGECELLSRPIISTAFVTCTPTGGYLCSCRDYGGVFIFAMVFIFVILPCSGYAFYRRRQAAKNIATLPPPTGQYNAPPPGQYNNPPPPGNYNPYDQQQGQYAPTTQPYQQYPPPQPSYSPQPGYQTPQTGYPAPPYPKTNA